MQVLRSLKSFLLPLLSLLVAPPLWGQATGIISGSVTDPSGSVLPGITVIAANAETSLARRVVTDNTGTFTFQLIVTGIYTIDVDRQGFAPFHQVNVVVQANSAVQVNVRLQLKGATDQVTVSSAPEMIQSAASNVVQVIEQRRVEDLPLNGRNVLQLLSLNAGVTTAGAVGGTRQINSLAGGSYMVNASINGSRGNATNFLLDNASNNDGYTNIAIPYPNPDAVQEVSVQTSTFDAQYGHAAGGVVSIVTKSGTNTFHGSGYEFVRNYALNARNFFSGRDALKRNQFGGTIGGPLLLGRLYDGRDRTFFFFSYQGTGTRTSTPGYLATLPSSAMKNGDFSAWLRPDGTGAIHDPLVPATYFPGNVIPASRIDPVAGKLLQYLPESTSSNYQVRYPTPTQQVGEDQYLFRADHSFNDRNRLSLRYFLFKYDQPWVTIPNNLTFVTVGQTAYAHNAAINYTAIANPQLLNQLTLAFNRESPTQGPPNSLYGKTLQDFGSKILAFSNFPTLNLSISNWSGISLGQTINSPESTYQISDIVSWTKGQHNVRLGGDWQQFRLNIISYYLSGGNISFTGQQLGDPGKIDAGNAFAEFLLGVGSSWRQQSVSSWSLKNNYPALFAQDDWKLTPRLTINLGLRWEPVFDFRESNRKEATFVPGQQSKRFVNAPLGLLYAGDKGFDSTIIPADWNNAAPRIGLAYQLLPKTVVRSAYGMFYDHSPAIVMNRSAQGQPFVNQLSITGRVSLSSPNGTAPPLNPSPIVPGTNVGFLPYGTWAIPSRDIRTGYMQNWNVVIEHQLTGDILMRASYIGSKGTKLLNAMEVNPAIYGPGGTAANVDSRRRYQPIGGLQLGMSNGSSSYNSLQLSGQRRFSRGVSVLANYTYSKSIDFGSYGSVEGNSGGPDPFNLGANRGLSDFDIRHRLVVSGVFEHPHFYSKSYLVRNALGGWQSNLIFIAESGVPFTVLSGVDNALMGVGGNFADYNGSGWGVSERRSQPEILSKYFNTSAFTVNAIGTIGTGRRNQLIGPGGWSADYSLFKNIGIWERSELQLRGEFFNVFNHPRFGLPNATVTSTIFGRITSASDPRIVQIALRLKF